MDFHAHPFAGALMATGFGLAVGSYANVVIYRSPRDGLSSFRPARSFCPGCRRQISWFDNIPVLSWLLLRARCRGCGMSISARYPMVEVLVGALFLGAWVLLLPPASAGAADADFALRLLSAFYLIATCVIVTAIDLEHLIIPDTITWPGMILGLASSLAFPVLQATHPGFRPDSPHGSSLIASMFGMLAGGGSLALVGLAGNVMLRRKLKEAGVQDSMGWGDVKWMALAGTFLGAYSVLGAIFIGCFSGAVVGLLLRLAARVRGHEAPLGLPFGPFLSLGILIEVAAPGIAWRVLEQITRPT